MLTAVLALLSEVIVMATVTVRGLNDEVRDRLRVRAAQHGRSMEQEIREILATAVAEPVEAAGLGTAICDRFAGIAVDLVLPGRDDPAVAVTLDEGPARR